MRMVFGVLSLLFVVAVVGFLAKNQLSSVSAVHVPPVAAPVTTPVVNPGGNVQQQSQQIQQQFKSAAEAALAPARTVPDDK